MTDYNNSILMYTGREGMTHINKLMKEFMDSFNETFDTTVHGSEFDTNDIKNIYNHNWTDPINKVEEKSDKKEHLRRGWEYLYAPEDKEDILDKLRSRIGISTNNIDTNNIINGIISTDIQNGTFTLSDYLEIKQELGL